MEGQAIFEGDIGMWRKWGKSNNALKTGSGGHQSDRVWSMDLP